MCIHLLVRKSYQLELETIFCSSSARDVTEQIMKDCKQDWHLRGICVCIIASLGCNSLMAVAEVLYITEPLFCTAAQYMQLKGR